MSWISRMKRSLSDSSTRRIKETSGIRVVIVSGKQNRNRKSFLIIAKLNQSEIIINYYNFRNIRSVNSNE